MLTMMKICVKNEVQGGAQLQGRPIHRLYTGTSHFQLFLDPHLEGDMAGYVV